MLSKSIQGTLTELESSIRVSVGQVSKERIQPKTIKKYLNFALQDIAQLLNGAAAPDYGTVWNISDAASSVSTTIRTGKSFTNSTRTVADTAHGLTSADVGRRFTGWVSTTRVVIAEIESITDANNFVITKALGADASATLNYSVFSAHSSTNINLSALVPAVDKIVKVKDSINGLVSPLGDSDFEAENITDHTDGVFWNKFGESLFVKKGSNVAAFGTLELYGYRQPYLLSANSDQIDIKDEYIPLVLAKATNYILVILKEQTPESLTSLISSETAKIRQINAEENAMIKQKSTSR